MSTEYSLYKSAPDSAYVVIVHNKLQVGWRCMLRDINQQLAYVIPHGWSVQQNTSHVGSLLAHFDDIEDLRANYPEFFI